MMRATIAEARAVALDSLDLVDLTGTPWRRIPLSATDPSIWCLVDTVDFPWLSENVWNVSWGSRTPWQIYAKRNVGPARATVRMHREIMIKADPRPDAFMADHHVHHGNGQTRDNRRANLAWLTKAENAAIRTPRERIPSLESIVLELLAGLGPRPLEEVPF